MSGIDYLAIACEYCGAPKGKGCTTSSGHTALPHDARTRPLINAWRVGFFRGRASLLDEVGAWHEHERHRLLIEQGGQP